MNYENSLKILEAFVKAEDDQTLNELFAPMALVIVSSIVGWAMSFYCPPSIVELWATKRRCPPTIDETITKAE